MSQITTESTTQSPRNALRHGLSSVAHLPSYGTDQTKILHLELIRVHQPQSAEERDCISELALARWKSSEIDRQLDLRAEAESAQAGQIFDRQMLDQFESDEKGWRSSPRFRAEILGNSFYGASLFEQLWTEIVAALNSPIRKITLQQSRNMALLVGSSWKIHELSLDGLWLISRFLKMENNPAQTILAWAHSCDTVLVAGDSQFIDHHFLNISDSAKCYKELHDRARKEQSYWLTRKLELEMEYATRRNQFIEMSMGTGLGDPNRTHEARLALRYQMTAQNRADKLTRRLDGLKRHRNLLEYRATMAQERKARRQERHSRDQLHAYQMPCDEQHDGELMANELDPAPINLECVESKTEQESTENDNPQVILPEVVVSAVQNKDQEHPIEFESRLQDRIERMMKGRNRSERTRIKKQVKAMRMEMAAIG
jgi:hypothetical protein